tara:strand:- start:385 stop:834 length:450 start_codon:yes stop_codon:yes gene_type:complete
MTSDNAMIPSNAPVFSSTTTKRFTPGNPNPSTAARKVSERVQVEKPPAYALLLLVFDGDPPELNRLSPIPLALNFGLGGLLFKTLLGIVFIEDPSMAASLPLPPIEDGDAYPPPEAIREFCNALAIVNSFMFTFKYALFEANFTISLLA